MYVSFSLQSIEVSWQVMLVYKNVGLKRSPFAFTVQP